MKWSVQNDDDDSYPNEGLRLPRDRQDLLTVQHWKEHLEAIGVCIKKKDLFSSCMAKANSRERPTAEAVTLAKRVKEDAVAPCETGAAAMRA